MAVATHTQREQSHSAGTILILRIRLYQTREYSKRSIIIITTTHCRALVALQFIHVPPFPFQGVFLDLRNTLLCIVCLVDLALYSRLNVDLVLNLATLLCLLPVGLTLLLQRS